MKDLTMDSVINFIKNFEGLGFWELLMVFGVTLLIFFVVHRLISFLPPTTAQTIRRIQSILSYSVLLVMLVFAALNSILTDNYSRLITTIAVIGLPYFRYLISSLYKLYDELVDRLTK